jgi:hypothetical protein
MEQLMSDTSGPGPVPVPACHTTPGETFDQWLEIFLATHNPNPQPVGTSDGGTATEFCYVTKGDVQPTDVCYHSHALRVCREVNRRDPSLALEEPPYEEPFMPRARFVELARQYQAVYKAAHPEEAAAPAAPPVEPAAPPSNPVAAQPTETPAPPAVALIPGGYTYRGRIYDLTGRPRAMLAALLGASYHRLTVEDLRTQLEIDDETVDYPDQVIRDTAAQLRASLRAALRAVGLPEEDPVPSIGRGEDLTYTLRLP